MLDNEEEGRVGQRSERHIRQRQQNISKRVRY